MFLAELHAQRFAVLGYFWCDFEVFFFQSTVLRFSESKHAVILNFMQILKGVLKGLPRSPSLRLSLVAQSGTVMIAQRESRQCPHRHGGDFIFAEKSALKCVVANVLTDLTVSFAPVAKQWRAIQMVNRVSSQIIQ